MLLAALVDVGADANAIYATLQRMPLDPWSWQIDEVRRGGLRACRVEVRVAGGGDGAPSHRRLADVLEVVEAGQRKGAISDDVSARASAVFRRIAVAEGRVHGEAPDAVTFHAVGQSDAVIDVVGVLLALEQLGVDVVCCSALPLSMEGSAWSGHGRVPTPSPATLEILRAVEAPLRRGDGADVAELVTPTGAALVAELATFERPPMRLQAVGGGAGGRDPARRANILRAWLAERDVTSVAAPVLGGDLRPVVVLETTIDDMTAEQVAFVRDQMLEAGALDVWLQPTGMKKGRSGWHLSLIARPEAEASLVGQMLRETSTLGVRVREERRYEAVREERTVETSLGAARVKVKRLAGEAAQFAPEFDDCARLAAAHDRPIMEVFALVQRAAEDQLGRD